MHQTVHPVVPCVLEDKEDGDLVGHLVDAGKRNRGLEAEVLTHRVEEPNLGKLDGKVGEEDEESALCLFPSRGDFVLRQISFGRDGAGKPGKRTAWIL